jgi:hypothetical protein
MRWVVVAGMAVACVAGCSSGTSWTAPVQPSNAIVLDNPLLVPPGDPEYVWETVVQVIGDYFRIMNPENPIRPVGDTFTEGELTTFPLVGATIFEPWAHDTANSYERIESTLQTIRRIAKVRVAPAPPGQAGFLVQVSVFKELEDLAQPTMAGGGPGAAGPAAFHYDGTEPRVVNPVDDQEITRGWIRQGRDPALEQRLLGQMYYRFYGGPSANPVRISQTLPPATQR